MDVPLQGFGVVVVSVIQQECRPFFGITNPYPVTWIYLLWEGERCGGSYILVSIFNRHHSNSVVKQLIWHPRQFYVPTHVGGHQNFKKMFLVLPFWLVPRDINSNLLYFLSNAPAQSLIHWILPVMCQGRKRVVLILTEPLLVLSNLGNLRQRNSASCP